MQLYKQVCTLAQSARLVELGVNIVPFLWWVQERAYPDNCNVLTAEHKPKGIDIDAFIILPAYTVAELGEMLPESFSKETAEPLSFYKVEKCFGEDKTLWFPNETIAILNYGYATEAEARAAMLIYLLEQGIIKPEEVNQSK